MLFSHYGDDFNVTTAGTGVGPAPAADPYQDYLAAGGDPAYWASSQMNPAYDPSAGNTSTQVMPTSDSASVADTGHPDSNGNFWTNIGGKLVSAGTTAVSNWLSTAGGGAGRGGAAYKPPKSSSAALWLGLGALGLFGALFLTKKQRA